MDLKLKPLMLAAVLSTAALAACGGGGGTSGGGSSLPPTAPQAGPTSAPTSSPTASPTTAPTLAPQSYAVSGNVVSIPQGAYGPSASPQTALSGATVVIGSTPVIGATPPATAPSGDVIVTTSASGAFNATLSQAPAAPTSAAPFMYVSTNVFNVTTPTSGYYVTVFGVGSDGVSAGALIPFHGFLPVTSGAIGTVRVTTANATEAAFLADVNGFRASVGAGALIFDEIAQEAARLHATDEATFGYLCHYDRQNVGPTSRYLRLLGLGADAENLAGTGAGPAAYHDADLAFEREAPNGSHYTNLIDSKHLWAGLAQANDAAGVVGYVDQELVSPSVYGSGTYPNSNCPVGITANGS